MWTIGKGDRQRLTSFKQWHYRLAGETELQLRKSSRSRGKKQCIEKCKQNNKANRRTLGREKGHFKPWESDQNSTRGNGRRKETQVKTMLAIHLQIMHIVNCKSSVDMERKAEDEPTVEDYCKPINGLTSKMRCHFNHYVPFEIFYSPYSTHWEQK